MATSEEVEQDRDWQALHDAITHVLDRFGTKDNLGKGDYWLLDDNWGWDVQQLEFQNLDLFKPEIVRLLQDTLIGYPK